MKRRIEPLLRHPPLRQPPRSRRSEPHRRLAADRRAEGEDAADHASDRAAASGHRSQGALRGVGQLVRHRRHARRRGARSARRAGRAFDAGEIPLLRSSTASATSWSGTTRRCCTRATLIDPDDARTLWRITVLEPSRRRRRAGRARADVRRQQDVALAAHRLGPAFPAASRAANARGGGASPARAGGRAPAAHARADAYAARARPMRRRARAGGARRAVCACVCASASCE